MTRYLVTTVPPVIEEGLLAELVRRHPHGDLHLERALKDAIRTTWATAAQYQEQSIR